MLGAWCWVTGAWCLVTGAWCLVLGDWCWVLGAHQTNRNPCERADFALCDAATYHVAFSRRFRVGFGVSSRCRDPKDETMRLRSAKVATPMSYPFMQIEKPVAATFRPNRKRIVSVA